MPARTATLAFQGRTESVSGTDFWSALKRRWSQRRTIRMLADLDDHMLHDIGVDRNAVGRPRHSMSDWVVRTRTGTQQIAFIGR
jgi:uncharacterized protein YjiS (DUF1127 family)